MSDKVFPFDPDSLDIEIDHMSNDWKEISVNYGLELAADHELTDEDEDILKSEIRTAMKTAINSFISKASTVPYPWRP